MLHQYCWNSVVLLMHLYFYNTPCHYKFNSVFSKTSTSMEESVQNIWSYKKTPVTEVLEIPQYFKLLLPSTLSSSVLSSPTNLQESPSTTFLSPLSSPFDCLFEKVTVEMMIWQCGSSLISHIIFLLYSGGLMLWYIHIQMRLSVPSGWSHQI